MSALIWIKIIKPASLLTFFKQNVFNTNQDFASMYLPKPSTTSRMQQKVNFTSGVQLVWIQNFSFPRLYPC